MLDREKILDVKIESFKNC